MIKACLIHEFRGDEPVLFLNNFAQVCEQNNATGLLINGTVDDLKQTNQQILQVINRDDQSTKTQNLIDIDAMRDASLLGIKNVIEGFTYHYDENLIN